MSNKSEIENFQQVVEQCHKMVFRTAMGFVHQKEDAEDLTQEVFIRAYRSWERFRGDSEVSTWLYRITVNLALSYINTKSRRSFIEIGEYLLNNLLGRSSNQPNPQQQMEQKERDRHIAAAIDSLPDKQRTAFVLSRIDELPQREVAEIMNTSEGAVEQLLIRAKANLQKKLNRTIGKEND